MTTTLERKYVLTRIKPGDYLLPSNDGKRLWRITRGTEESYNEETKQNDTHEVWQAWRYRDVISWAGQDELPDDFLDWSEWELYDSWCETREGAIQAALKVGQA